MNDGLHHVGVLEPHRPAEDAGYDPLTDLGRLGDVLIAVGVVGLVVSLIWAAMVTRRSNSQTTTVVER